jgi:hypothetical protein
MATSITAITTATVTNKSKRFILRYFPLFSATPSWAAPLPRTMALS